ncbi:hypothetical protein NM688_g2098 [Phlebia brevispora]|uniref:Uncharacterized protein n=1 Tax=Phlebia brevispora TaxID=194682 RepID=A0ACC1T988_9APHY|nr:hypothetical protein NM688_g2098 [Phlebia brevispora]
MIINHIFPVFAHTFCKRLRSAISTTEVLDWANTATSTLAMVADGLSVPGLRISVGVAQQVIAIAQTIHDNRAGAIDLAKRASEYVCTIAEVYQGKAADSLDHTFHENVNSLNNVLDEILQIVSKIAARKMLKRVLRFPKDKRRLDEASQMLQRVFERFRVGLPPFIANSRLYSTLPAYITQLVNDIIVAQGVIRSESTLLGVQAGVTEAASRVFRMNEDLSAVHESVEEVGEDLVYVGKGVAHVGTGLAQVGMDIARVDMGLMNVGWAVDSVRTDVAHVDADVQALATQCSELNTHITMLTTAAEKTERRDEALRDRLQDIATKFYGAGGVVCAEFAGLWKYQALSLFSFFFLRVMKATRFLAKQLEPGCRLSAQRSWKTVLSEH